MEDEKDIQIGDMDRSTSREKSSRDSQNSAILTSGEDPFEDWRAGKQEWLIIVTLVLISLLAAIDATILVPVLPVRNIVFQ